MGENNNPKPGKLNEGKTTPLPITQAPDINKGRTTPLPAPRQDPKPNPQPPKKD